jgi:molybdenum cofactor cytidylyltransferase
MPSSPTLVVLAAGPGRRFLGTDHKLEQPFGGASVLGTTLRHAIDSRLPVLLVTTERLAPLAAGLLAARDVLVLAEADTRRGIGHSIAAGVAERASSPGWLVLPGDMPVVRPATLRAVAAALVEHPVACAQYRGRRGYPVGFAAELYSELVMLTGDDGARRLIARYPAHGEEVDDPGVLVDVDTVADLEALREQQVAEPLPRQAP